MLFLVCDFVGSVGSVGRGRVLYLLGLMGNLVFVSQICISLLQAVSGSLVNSSNEALESQFPSM